MIYSFDMNMKQLCLFANTAQSPTQAYLLILSSTVYFVLQAATLLCVPLILFNSLGAGLWTHFAANILSCLPDGDNPCVKKSWKNILLVCDRGIYSWRSGLPATAESDQHDKVVVISLAELSGEDSLDCTACAVPGTLHQILLSTRFASLCRMA